MLIEVRQITAVRCKKLRVGETTCSEWEVTANKGSTRAVFEDLLRRYLPAIRRLAWSYTGEARGSNSEVDRGYGALCVPGLC